MEAKDTIIKDLSVPILNHLDLPMGQAIAIEQAEISFKAGYDQAVADSVDQLKLMFKAGIKEVVECLNELSQEFKVSLFKDVIQSPFWQAKLEEWGL